MNQSAISLELLLDEPVALMWFFAIETSFQIPNETPARMMKRIMMMMAITSFFFILAVGELSGECLCLSLIYAKDSVDA